MKIVSTIIDYVTLQENGDAIKNNTLVAQFTSKEEIIHGYYVSWDHGAYTYAKNCSVSAIAIYKIFTNQLIILDYGNVVEGKGGFLLVKRMSQIGVCLIKILNQPILKCVLK